LRRKGRKNVFANRLRALFAIIGLAFAMVLTVGVSVSHADDPSDEKSPYPTTEFAEGARTAVVTSGDVTATITMERRKDVNPDVDVPVLHVVVGGKPVLESVGIDADVDEPAAAASIAEMDPGNHHPEVYFSSYNGGCCSTVIVAEEAGDHWVAVPVGDFDGDEDYLRDLDGDGVPEIATIDINFLSRFDCTACSAAPRVIYTVKNGAIVDLTKEPRFLDAHRAWLKEIEDSVEPADRWDSKGFLAGWLAEKIRVGEGATAWADLNSHWNSAADEGEETCPNGDDPDQCAKNERKVLKFPEQLRLFLTNAGYTF
jgi:hypothetical protein